MFKRIGAALVFTAIVSCFLLCGGDGADTGTAIVQKRVDVFEQGDMNPLFSETKIPNYLPHMTWPEAEQALTRTDMVLIPVGSIEQHGKHLPLCTDTYAAIEVCKLIAQQTDVIVAPAVFPGLSKHHMGFPGSLTLSPETFEAVLFETAECLIGHGFDKVMFYNGHGGNNTSVANVIQKINQETGASAVFLSQIELPREGAPESIAYDWHAGVDETSFMLYLTNPLVQMDKAEQPALTLPPVVQRILDNPGADPNLTMIRSANLFRPEDAGKLASSAEMSSNGVFTSGQLSDSSVERGKKKTERFVRAAVKFIEEWKRLSQ